jgi:hypothetical protein
MDPKPKRVQYFFDTTGIKYKSRADILKMQRQWETFERIENFNDVIYQRLEMGLRDRMYYQFRNREELTDYRMGQELHVLRYPTLPSSAFSSISERPMPDVEFTTAAPLEIATTADRALSIPVATSASELTATQTDMAIYVYVSTFNATHVMNYPFVSNEEKLAYHRAERRILDPTT